MRGMSSPAWMPVCTGMTVARGKSFLFSKERQYPKCEERNRSCQSRCRGDLASSRLDSWQAIWHILCEFYCSFVGCKVDMHLLFSRHLYFLEPHDRLRALRHSLCDHNIGIDSKPFSRPFLFNLSYLILSLVRPNLPHHHVHQPARHVYHLLDLRAIQVGLDLVALQGQRPGLIFGN